MTALWLRLKNAVEAAVTDLRFLLNTQRVPFNLVDSIETLEWIMRIEPTNQDARDALVVTVGGELSNLDGYTGIADDYGYTVLRDRIACVVRSVRPALAGYSD